ncbi:hypothetical protein H0E84_14685 [Luteimonas sp. SJ-92]|uniref:Lipoprotein n=1 Tax=Luteimonas salinisoli TaxID=2752307 RepID=A0A853JFU5_9GAMM|nr:hypothetical protein [Luteimonas salinisoli]NZA27624.1 hypothetical protein [Luteimonas salinisoli]
MSHSVGHTLRLVAPLMLLLATAGCDRANKRGGSADAVPTPREAPVVEPAGGPLADVRRIADGERPDPRRAVLMDMRVDAKARTADPDEDTRRAVAASLGGGEVRILGTLEGAFTRPRAREEMHLVETGDGGRWILVVGRDEALRLPGEDIRYLLASPDIDGNGTNEVLLRLDREEDGAIRTDLRLLTFTGEQPVVVADFSDARVDACAAPSPSLRAQRIEYGRPAGNGDWPDFVVVASESECIDGRAPDLEGYLRAERPAG